jgi:putative membrane protein
MQTEVGRCVHQIFSQHGIGGTRHNGGLLIYVSLFEHRLEIHCDNALTGKLAPTDLETIRDAVLAQVRTGKLTAGLIAGLDEAEKILSTALPHTDNSLDALQNEVLVFHPRP